MDNASRILLALDDRLDHPVRLVLYGRAAIQLGFDSPPGDVANSMDVDVIIPSADVANLTQDTSFWDAQEAANDALRPHGLYLTHLFPSDMVFLRRSWERHLVKLCRPVTRNLHLWRPATLDLILTKMMRGDDSQDLADVEFLIHHDSITRADLLAAFSDAVLPDLQELRDAFEKAKPRVLSLPSR